MGNASTAATADQSAMLRIETAGPVLSVGLNRPAKRNALNDGIMLAIQNCFSHLPEDIGAVVIHGVGDHFSSGLDLSEPQGHDATGGLLHSQVWHRVFDGIQYSRVPVIAALKGGVIGGGLELACSAHIRVAEPSTYFALPEGQRGIFVGGGGSVRLPRLIGVARMMDMMLTGRVYSATEGASYGFAQYVTEAGNGLSKALELATKVASNAPLTNFAVLQALPMIAEANPQTGLLMELLTATRHIASSLIQRGLSAERPVVILSGNSIDHALLAFGAFYAGIPFCPVSPAYSLVSKDYGKLSYLMKLLTPGLVFAENADKFADALAANVSLGTEIAASYGHVPGRDVTLLADLMATPIRGDLDEVHGKIGPDTIAKFLLTSGSTGNPKAVINTQRMICANQVMLRETLAFLKDEPPVIIDWLPWNHTFGGNHNIGLTLFNGGSMYLDEGKPMPGGIEETVRNLREISPTVYFNVPKGYESLLPYLRDDAGLRKKFFARLHAMFFSGAALSAFVWNSLDELSVQQTGYRVPLLTGLGATETAPFFMSVNPRTSRSGHVGLPVSGNDAKLVPNNGKLEIRAKGPNVMPGYCRQPDITAKSFHEEGV